MDRSKRGLFPGSCPDASCSNVCVSDQRGGIFRRRFHAYVFIERHSTDQISCRLRGPLLSNTDEHLLEEQYAQIKAAVELWEDA